MKEYLSNS